MNETQTETRTVRVGRRTWQVRNTWQGRGTRQVRIVRTQQRRTGWPEGQWREVRGVSQPGTTGQTTSVTWS